MCRHLLGPILASPYQNEVDEAIYRCMLKGKPGIGAPKVGTAGGGP
jgi:hypothetical protein